MMRIENYIRIAACSLLLLVSGTRADIVTVGPNGEVIVSGQNTYTPVRVGGVNSHIVLDSITIRDGFSMFDAGGISIHGSAVVEMNNCVIEDNHAGEL
ncbi:MAG: hypothetical protein ACF8LL_12195, partial [Phycisphaerales bacterium]